MAQQRPYVAGYAACVCCECGCLLSSSVASQDAPGFGRFEIVVAKIGDCRGLALVLFLAGRIGAVGYLDKEAACCRAGHVRRPGCAMAADCMPSLPAGGRAVLEKVGDDLALLPASAEPGYSSFAVIPKDRSRRQACDCLEREHVVAS
jgi:hypothetical protein